jgi:hypothetical protein
LIVDIHLHSPTHRIRACNDRNAVVYSGVDCQILATGYTSDRETVAQRSELPLDLIVE